jgi:hypothetical protein
LGNYQVDGQTLLPLDRYGETPGKSVLAQFVQASTTSRPLESLPVEVRSFPGLDPAVVRAAQLGVQSVSGLVPYWPPGVPVTFLVTEDSLDGEAWLRAEASTLGCPVGERWYPFDKEELPGSFSLGTCAGPGFTLVLNVSQFARPWADADLSRVIVTVGDDLFGLWQEYYNSGVLASEPRWLTQGSQQLPFLVYLARYAPGQVFRPSLSPGCLPDLTLYDFEDVAFNTEVSCPHEVGRAAMLLLVSRVGLDPVVKYFTQPASSLSENFEERFNDLAGESYRKFYARLLSWLTASN